MILIRDSLSAKDILYYIYIIINTLAQCRSQGVGIRSTPEMFGLFYIILYL